MGVYNVIKSKMKCPKCESKVEWQSKYLTYDGHVIENLLQDIVLTEHMAGEMHTSCSKCKALLEVTIVKGKEGKIKPRKLYKKQ